MVTGIVGGGVKRHGSTSDRLPPPPVELIDFPQKNTIVRGSLKKLDSQLLLKATTQGSIDAMLNLTDLTLKLLNSLWCYSHCRPKGSSTSVIARGQWSSGSKAQPKTSAGLSYVKLFHFSGQLAHRVVDTCRLALSFRIASLFGLIESVPSAQEHLVAALQPLSGFQGYSPSPSGAGCGWLSSCCPAWSRWRQWLEWWCGASGSVQSELACSSFETEEDERKIMYIVPPSPPDNQLTTNEHP